MRDFTHEGPQPEPKQADFREYWSIVLKRKWLIITFAVTVFAVVTITSFLQTPIFKAKGTLGIEREPNIFSFESRFQLETYNDDYFQTQYKLLESRSLAEETINRMKLGENARPSEGTNKDSFDRSRMTDLFLTRLKVTPIPQTRLVEVTFKSPNPKIAADTLNTLFAAFIDMNVQKKNQASAQTSDFLTRQITVLSAEIQNDAEKLQAYGAEKNIVALGDKETTVVETLGALNKAFTDAQIERVQKEAYYTEIRAASPDILPSIINNSLIQRLREDYARLNREYTKNQGIMKPDYPEMQRLKSDLEAAKTVLGNEMQSLINSAYGDFQAALKKEKSLEAVFNQQKREANRLNSNSIQYNALKIEIDNKKSVLESLLRRRSETGVSAQFKDIQTANIWIVDRAETPLAPSSPNKRMNMILALLIGLGGGLGLVFLFERLDNSVKNYEDVEKYVGLPMLGLVPSFTLNGLQKQYRSTTQVDKGTKSAAKPNNEDIHIPFEMISSLAPNSTYAEHFRSIRTTLILAAPEKQLKTIVVTSALPKEGKTSTVSNLAATLALAGKRVLIIDADLRNPNQHTIFNIKNTIGLSNYISGSIPIEKVTSMTSIPQLYIINAGPVPPNPVELLGSDKMASLLEELKSTFDYILIDTPPVLNMSDAIVLGPKIDGMIIVVRGEKTSRQALRRVRDKLDLHRIKSVGVIINNVRLRDFEYYGKNREYSQPSK